MEDYDIIVIGSGLSGLAFSRFYLDIHPTANLTILESDTCIGGVWSSSRSYTHFWIQSSQRMAGFSDIPLRVPVTAPLYHDTFEAKYVTDYLEEYVDLHVYSGRTLRSRVRFGCCVGGVEKEGMGWRVSVCVCVKDKGEDEEGEDEEKKMVLRCKKLVVATGHTSIPNIPTFSGQEQFNGPIIHHRFYASSNSLLNSPTIQKITILGGGKSAVDMVYQSVKEGKSVSWVIRASGEGPALLIPASAPGTGGGGRYRNSVEMMNTRYKAWFSPSSFMPRFWLLRLWHWSGYGVGYMKRRIRGGDEGCRAAPMYRDRKGALKGFENLETEASAFWYTGPIGVSQHNDFWDLISKNVHIHRADITSLTPTSILLSNGIEIPTDALLCGTGWKSTYPFLTTSLHDHLGLPRPLTTPPNLADETQTHAFKNADKRVLASFPILASPPPSPHIIQDKPTTLTKLYKGILPLTDQTIAFLGHVHLSNGFRCAEAQAIWTTAFWDGNLRLPSKERMREETLYMNAFSRRRYPSRGQAGDCLFFEVVWYTDSLMRDVGVGGRCYWKGLGWWWLGWRGWVEPCLQGDFGGVVGEYRRRFGGG